MRVSRTVISALTERETVMTSGETLGLKHGEGKVPLIFSILTLRVKGEKIISDESLYLLIRI